MGTRLASRRDTDLLRLLRSEFGGDLAAWLQAQGSDLHSKTFWDAWHAPAGGLDTGDGEPGEKDEAARVTYCPPHPSHEDGWLLRHVLDPASPDCLLPPDRAKAVRARLLAKLRDRTRIARGPVLTVRVPEETALQLDEIGRRLFGSTSRSSTVKAMARVAATQLWPPKEPHNKLDAG